MIRHIEKHIFVFDIRKKVKEGGDVTALGEGEEYGRGKGRGRFK